MAQISLKIDDEEKHKFEATTKKLGLSTTSALKMFIAKFNRDGGFDFTVTLADKSKLPTEIERALITSKAEELGLIEDTSVAVRHQ